MSGQLDIVVANRYRLVRSIGKGGFGEVFEAVDVRTNTTVALKAELLSVDNSILLEYHLYKDMQRKSGVPKVYEYIAEADDYRVLAFELLGPTLVDLLDFCGGRFSTKTILLLADQLLVRIKNIHQKLHLHLDIKPTNMLIGSGRSKNVIYLVDLGIATPFDPDYEEGPASEYDPNNGAPLTQGRRRMRPAENDEDDEDNDEEEDGEDEDQPADRQDQHMPFAGTVLFASANAHVIGRTLTPKDDLWSLLFNLVFLHTGTLPWLDIAYPCDTHAQHAAMYRAKRDVDPQELCHGMPDEFVQFCNYLRRLRNDNIKYDKLRRIFASCFRKCGFRHQGTTFDWVEKMFWLRAKEEKEKEREKAARVREEMARKRIEIAQKRAERAQRRLRGRVAR